jgi:hypothetical protein
MLEEKYDLSQLEDVTQLLTHHFSSKWQNCITITFKKPMRSLSTRNDPIQRAPMPTIWEMGSGNPVFLNLGYSCWGICWGGASTQHIPQTSFLLLYRRF